MAEYRYLHDCVVADLNAAMREFILQQAVYHRRVRAAQYQKGKVLEFNCLVPPQIADMWEKLAAEYPEGQPAP